MRRTQWTRRVGPRREARHVRVRAVVAFVAALGVWAGVLPVAHAEGEHHRPTRLVWNHFEPDVPLVRLVVGDIRTGRTTVLTRPGAGRFDTEPVRSPDGRSVVFNRESDAGVQIVVARIDRPGVDRVIDTGCGAVPDCAADVNPTWAPDGRHILFTRVLGPFDPVFDDAASALLMISRLDGSDVRRFSEPGTSGSTKNGGEDDGARFAPDGRHVVFLRDQRIDGELFFAIFRMNVNGTGVQQLTEWALNADRPSVSPARQGVTAGLVAFETFGGAQPRPGDIALVPLMCRSLTACTRATRLVTHNAGGPRSSFAATWSPNGQRLAYAQAPDTSGKVDIWTSRWNGDHAREVTFTGREFSPSWSF
jgi:Tol biopolymer transport system component